ncbi:MAG: hypothetical protein ABJH52_07545 [Henriciella sp.]
MRWLFKIKSLFSTAAFIVIAALPAEACMCPPETSAESQAAQWDLVAQVQVLEEKRIEPKRSFWSRLAFWRTPPPPQSAELRTRMKVIRLIKGSADGEIIIHSSEPGMPACGIRYPIGEEITLLSNKNDAGNFGSYSCSRPQFSAAEFHAALTE